MKIKELRDKSKEDLQKVKDELCVKRHELEFKLASKQHKNVREMRTLKKTVARVLTLLNVNK
ncbi:MAG: 50S ribosomal protein L29 [Patescibacteria group bacterium]